MAVNEQMAALRAEYETDGISKASMASDPVVQFGLWMDDAIAAGVHQANAMVLASANVHGRPSSRAVLLKGFDSRGFVFYTKLESRKGTELQANPWASLTFLWMDLHRQIRIEGPISKVSEEESDEYFSSRPRESQIASAASPQSRTVADRPTLQRLVADLAASVGDGEVARPERWAGLRVNPVAFEFWQGRVHRLHDRIVYQRADSEWAMDRLAP